MTEIQVAFDDRHGITTLALGMPSWKHPILRRYFPERHFVFPPVHISARQLEKDYPTLLTSEAEVFIWGLGARPEIVALLERCGVRLHILEDGFLRSRNAFASRTLPLSLTLDSRTAHFDAEKSSDLERLLETYPFAEDNTLRARAAAGIAALLARGITKYNGGERLASDTLYGAKHQRRVLVLGQVDGDASIRFGCPSRMTQTELVHLAVAENPDCEVIFRPHPDVLNRVRPSKVNLHKLSRICRVVTTPSSITTALETIDRVYTLTSLGGFEALMRGISVTVIGYPFYAGWGLTDDRSSLTRRKRRLGLYDVFAAAYLIYPKYFDPKDGTPCRFEDTLLYLQISQSPPENEARDKPVQTALRHRVAVTVIRPIVVRIGSGEDGRYFSENPYEFLQERSSPWLRRLGRLLFKPAER